MYCWHLFSVVVVQYFTFLVIKYHIVLLNVAVLFLCQRMRAISNEREKSLLNEVYRSQARFVVKMEAFMLNVFVLCRKY